MLHRCSQLCLTASNAVSHDSSAAAQMAPCWHNGSRWNRRVVRFQLPNHDPCSVARCGLQIYRCLQAAGLTTRPSTSATFVKGRYIATGASHNRSMHILHRSLQLCWRDVCLYDCCCVVARTRHLQRMPGSTTHALAQIPVSHPADLQPLHLQQHSKVTQQQLKESVPAPVKV